MESEHCGLYLKQIPTFVAELLLKNDLDIL